MCKGNCRKGNYLCISKKAAGRTLVPLFIHRNRKGAAGKVQLAIPAAGNAAQAVSGFPGKVSASCLIGAAVLLQAAGAWVRCGRIKN